MSEANMMEDDSEVERLRKQLTALIDERLRSLEADTSSLKKLLVLYKIVLLSMKIVRPPCLSK